MRIFILCLLSVALLAGNARSACTGAPATTCKAFKNLDIVEGSTKCSGKATIDCKLVEDAKVAILDAYKTWLEEGFCDSRVVRETSATVAGIIAGLLANGLENVTCEGKGLLCGYEVTNTAWALSLQEVLAETATDAGFETFTDDYCYGDLRGVSDAIQSAVAGVSDTCTEGGNLEDYKASVVSTVSPALEEALGRSRAVFCGDRKLRRGTWCSRSGGRRAPGGPAIAGDPCGATGVKKECTGTGLEMCCSGRFTTSICGCRGCNGPWIRVTRRRDPEQVFKDKAGVLCTCPQADRRG